MGSFRYFFTSYKTNDKPRIFQVTHNCTMISLTAACMFNATAWQKIVLAKRCDIYCRAPYLDSIKTQDRNNRKATMGAAVRVLFEQITQDIFVFPTTWASTGIDNTLASNKQLSLWTNIFLQHTKNTCSLSWRRGILDCYYRAASAELG